MFIRSRDHTDRGEFSLLHLKFNILRKKEIMDIPEANEDFEDEEPEFYQMLGMVISALYFVISKSRTNLDQDYFFKKYKNWSRTNEFRSTISDTAICYYPIVNCDYKIG